MIYGVGADIVEIKRVLRACQREGFLRRTYTENEISEAFGDSGIDISLLDLHTSEAAEKKAAGTKPKGAMAKNAKLKRLATDFAAKEAVSKALRTGFRDFGPADIECLRDELGAPYIVLHGRAAELSGGLGISRIHISLSDTGETAAAFAVAEID